MAVATPIDPVEAIKEAMPDAVMDVKEFRGETTIVVDRERIVDVARYVRNTEGLSYNFLSDISAADYYPDYDRPGRFGVSYHLLSILYKRRLRLKVFVDEDETVVPTVVRVWPAADWLEREIHDMMGIYFDGHPDMRRLLMPDDWDGHPHRRDYPLGYETIQFSFNVEDILEHKPKAQKNN